METLVTLQITIFLLVAVGFVLKRIHIVGPQGQKNINDMVIYVILPCNILRAFLDSPAENGFLSYLEVLIISVFIQAFCVIYGKIAFRKEPEGRQKCLRYGTICSNAGFLGNPIAEGVYGAEGLMLASIYLIPQRIMMWSSGLAVFSGTSDKKQTIKKVLTHPCILACILGIIFMLADIQLPPGLDGMVTAVGNLLGQNSSEIYDSPSDHHTRGSLCCLPFSSAGQNRVWNLCSSGGNAGRRHNEYTGGKI